MKKPKDKPPTPIKKSPPVCHPLATDKEALASLRSKKPNDPALLELVLHLYSHMEAAMEQIDKLVTQMTRLKASVVEVVKDIEALKKRPGISPADLAQLDAIGSDLSAETDKLVAEDVPDENPPPTPTEPPTA